MAINEDSVDLLFLDTFMHDNSEDLNLDLVQFSKSVIVHEVLVIPSGCKVISDIPGAVAIGSTIPSSFKLEFFVNNLEYQRNSTFEKIGLLEYHENSDILLKSENKIPTDGLIIKGWYQTITLAVYGRVTSLSRDTSPPPPPPTSQRSKLQSVLPIGSSNKCQEKFDVSQKPLVPSLDSKSLTNLYEGFNPKDIPLEHSGPAKDPREKDGINDGTSDAPSLKSSDKIDNHLHSKSSKNSAMESEDHDDRQHPRKRHSSEKQEEFTEKKKKETSPDPFFDEDVIEPGEIADPGDNTEENVDIYGTLSDGEILDGEADFSQVQSEDTHMQFTNCIPPESNDLGEWETSEEGPWSFTAMGSFNPYQCDLAPLETFPDPSLTPYEVEKRKLKEPAEHQRDSLPASASELLKLLEEHKDSNLDHGWVEAIEAIPNFICGLPYLLTKDNKDLLDTLIRWSFEAMDLNRIIQLKEAQYRLRLMKAGMRLGGCLCTCDPDVANKMLEKNVQHKLLDLFSSDHMSTPVRLIVLQSLDQSLRFKEGFDFFFGNYIKKGIANGQDSLDAEVKYAQNPYQRVLEMLQKKHTSQILVGLKAIIRKCHFYEILLKLSSFIDCLVKKVPPPEVRSEATESSSGDVVEEMINNDVDVDFEVECVVQCLDEIYRILSEADVQINQPVRAFTKTVRFDSKPVVSSLPCIYHLFNSCHFLEEIFVLLTSPATCNNSEAFASVKSIFNFLVTCHSGLLFLSSRVDTVNGILRSLTQSTDFTSEEDRELSPANQLGLTMIYYLQTMQHIDQLNEYRLRGMSLSSGDANETAVLAVLLNLNSIMFSQQGRDALVTVFSLDANISSLINFIELTAEEEMKSQRSVCFAYAMNILLVIARCSDKVDWLEKFGHQILGLLEREIKSGKADDKVRELQDWLSPMKHLSSISYDSSTVSVLVNLLRQYAEEINEIPKPMITVLRILKHLSVFDDEKGAEGAELLKFQWVLAEIFGANCLPLFTNILQKVKEMLLLSWQQGFPQSASERSLVLSLVVPVLHLVRSLLSALIMARGTDFKDLSVIPSLLGLHTVLCSVSPTGVLPHDLQRIQNMIVDTLMTYTQPAPSLENSEEAIGKTLWSMMTREILKYTLVAPYTFLSGLVLLSEMLPLPLPMQSKESLSKKDTKRAMAYRKKWSAHLQPHFMEIEGIIRNLAGTSCQPLIQLLRRTCWQLADLSPSMSLFIVRSLLDTLAESLNYSIDPSMKSMKSTESQSSDSLASCTNATSACENATGEKANSLPAEEVPSSGRTARILNLLSFLTNQPVVKAAFLSIIRNELQVDGKYGDVVKRMCKLLNMSSEDQSHVKSQETLVGIIQSLCDPEISLITQENCSCPVEQLSNGLPPKDFLILFCESLLTHIGNRDQKFSSILPALRTLTLLMGHDYGFYYVKQAMEKDQNSLFNLFMQINATFSKDSSDCIATLSSAAECIQFLVLPSATYPANPEKNLFPAVDDSFPTSPAHRTYRMTFRQVKDALGWSKMEDVRAHPLHDLDSLLCEYTKDEETLKAVYECVHAILGILKSEEEQKIEKDVVELELMEPDILRDQFERRVVCSQVEEDDDMLTAAYWLSTPMGDESDQEQDCEKNDLIEMASNYCPGFDLEGELKKGTTSSEASLLPRLKSKLLMKKQGDTINTSKMKGTGNFVAPLRGRGFTRGGSGGLGRGDIFRSRPPNTSRPPSMHVDDFVKMETQNQQPAPPDMIPVSITASRRPEDILRGGHTFDRGAAARFIANRWQPLPTPFSHREDSAALVRGAYRGLSLMTGRGIMRGTATGSPTKAVPWIFRRNNYGAFGRGDGSLQDPIERLDRRNAGYSYVHGASTLQWQDHKDREADQRFVGMPIESFSLWRERHPHQRTSNR